MNNRRLLACASLLCGVSVALLFLYWLTLLCPSVGLIQYLWMLSWGPVILFDLYLLSILRFAALRSDADAGVADLKPPRRESVERWFPTRYCGISVLGLILAGLITAFACIYLGLSCSVDPHITGPVSALYASLMILGFGGPTPETTAARLTIITESLSGILFLVVALPLLVGRLSTFRDAGVKEPERMIGRIVANGKVKVIEIQADGPSPEEADFIGTVLLATEKDQLVAHVSGSITLKRATTTIPETAAGGGAQGNGPQKGHR